MVIIKWVMKMFNEVEIGEYEGDEFLSVFKEF